MSSIFAKGCDFSGQIEYQILNEPPPPLPDGLRWAPCVQRGLSKVPAVRPDSCAGVLDSDLRVPRVPSPVPCAEKPREVAVPQPPSDSKSPLLWSLAALAAVALGGMLWNGVRQKGEPVANETAVQRPAAETRRQDDAFGGVQLWEGGPYWAECNMGATKPEEAGYYFWWGDTVGYRREGDAWTAVVFQFVQSGDRPGRARIVRTDGACAVETSLRRDEQVV